MEHKHYQLDYNSTFITGLACLHLFSYVWRSLILLLVYMAVLVLTLNSEEWQFIPHQSGACRPESECMPQGKES